MAAIIVMVIITKIKTNQDMQIKKKKTIMALKISKCENNNAITIIIIRG